MAGRKRKSGSRYPGGKLRPAFDKGSRWVQERKERFGEHYSTALGRAYAAGLLGEGSEAKNRYDAGKKYARLYRRVIGGEFYRCPLDDTPRGNVIAIATDLDEDDQKWIYAAIDSLHQDGSRPYFEQLVTRQNTDTGPPWLDRILEVRQWNALLPRLNAQRRKQGMDRLNPREVHNGDNLVLEAAIRALDIIAPEYRPIGIRVENW